MEALDSLAKITAIRADISKTEVLRILNPDEFSQKILNEAGIKLPKVLPKKSVNVVTYKNLKMEHK